MSSSFGTGSKDDAAWRRLWHAWLKSPIHRFAYERDQAGNYTLIDAWSFIPEDREKEFAALQKRLREENSEPTGEPGVVMDTHGCPVRYPKLRPDDRWVRPHIKVGKNKSRRRPFFTNPRSQSDLKTARELRAAREYGERLAATDEILAGAEAAGWDFSHRLPLRQGHVDAACWTSIAGREAHVAFRVQLNHRNLGEFGELAAEAREKGVHLIWLVAERDGKEVATLPYRIAEVPVVRMQALLKQHGEATAPQPEGSDDLFRVTVGGSGPAESLTLARYVERVLREIRLRLDPSPRLFFAHLGWVTCRGCGKRCLSYGDFEPNTRTHFGFEGWQEVQDLLGNHLLPLADVVDRAALQDFRARVVRRADGAPVAEIAWADEFETWRGYRHCPDPGCGERLPSITRPRAEAPDKLAVRFRLTEEEMDRLLGPMHDRGMSAHLFAARRAPDPQRLAEARAGLERAGEALAAAEAAWQDFARRRRDTAQALREAEGVLRALDAARAGLVADRERFAALAAEEAALPGLQQELRRLEPLLADGPEVRRRWAELDLRIAETPEDRKRCLRLEAEAAAVDPGEIARRIGAHDASVPGEIERFRMAWRAEATRNARAERDAAAQALEQWRATPRRWWPSWAWNRGGAKRSRIFGWPRRRSPARSWSSTRPPGSRG